MSLQTVYQGFLADPKSAPLAPDVSLIYITTTTRFDQAEAVVSHLSKQQKIVKKKSEDIISAVEGPDSLCVDVESTLEFVTGGGAYLPSLDDNFLADRVATFPTVRCPLIDQLRPLSFASNLSNSCMLFDSISRGKSSKSKSTGIKRRC